MSDGIVAACALQSFGAAVHHVAVNRRSYVLVAAAAGVLGDFLVELRDLEGVGIFSAGEVKRVPETIVGLNGVPPDEIVRRVAIVTHSDRMMARLHTGVVLRLHDVAVGAGSRIIAEVGITLGVNEGVGPQANGSPDQDCKHN